MRYLSLLAATAVLCCSTLSATASIQKNDIIKLQNGPGLGNGGEFIVQKKNPDNSFSNVFNTFCVELAETITFNTQYKVSDISRKTVATNKPLTVATAWLFSKFIEGFNAGLDFVIGAQPYSLSNTAQRDRDARSLQLAIWSTMGWDISGQANYNNSNATNTAIKNKADYWITLASGQSDPDGNYFNVGIMNLVEKNGNGNRQDQLVIVPEASTIAVWSVLSLLGVGAAYRKRVSKA